MKYFVEKNETGKYYLWIDNSGSEFGNVELARGMNRRELTNVLHYLNGGTNDMAIRDAKACLLSEKEPTS